MKTDASFGIIPVYLRNGRRQYLIVQHRKGHWGFPKGHPEAGETSIQTARRELKEETGITKLDVFETPVLRESYVFTKKSGRKVLKHVTYFVAMVADDRVQIQPEEVAAYAWGDATETRALLTFVESQHLLNEAEAFLDSLCEA